MADGEIRFNFSNLLIATKDTKFIALWLSKVFPMRRTMVVMYYQAMVNAFLSWLSEISARHRSKCLQ